MSAKATHVKESAKGVLTSLTAGVDGAKHEAQEQAAPEPISEPEGEVVQPEAAGEVEGPAHQEQAVLDPQPATLQPAERPQDTEQPTEQNGKESLPAEDEGEEDFENEEEDFEEEKVEEQEAEPTFTDQDRADLPVLEAKVKHHGLEHSRAIREIRQRKLWMQHRNDDGSRKYKNYDQYVADFHGRSRQWATDQTQHVTMVEKLAELRAQGVDVPEMLTRTAVSGMHHLVECGNYQGDTEDEQEEAGLIAVLQEAAQDGKSLSGENLRAICNRRYQYFTRYRWRAKPLAATYDEYKKDLALVEPLSKVDRSERNSGKVKEWAETNNATMPEAVMATFKQNCSLPDNDFLLSVATGNELNKLVADLVALGDKIASIQEAERLAKENQEKARQTRASIGVPPKPRKGKSGKPTPSDPEPEPGGEEPDEDGVNADTISYKVELTGDFAEALGWAAKDDVSHEDLLSLFETLGGNNSPITVPSSVKVVPVGKDTTEDDLDEYEPEKIGEDKAADVEKPKKPRLLDPSDPDDKPVEVSLPHDPHFD